MTIKQQGGIFGRNPSFNDVNAVDLEVTNRLGINEASPDARLQVSGSRMNSASEGVVVEGTWPWVMLKDTESGQASFVQYVDGGNYIVKTIPHADKDSAPNGVGTEVFRWNSSGNLALPNGKGIDFSATSGTGTSELFDDYEEGTFTPTISSSSGTITSSSVTSAVYTKIGRLVTVHVDVTITDAGTGSGALNFTLPFTNGSAIAMGAGRENAATGNMLQVIVGASGAIANVFNYDNSTPIVTNNVCRATVTYTT